VKKFTDSRPARPGCPTSLRFRGRFFRGRGRGGRGGPAAEPLVAPRGAVAKVQIIEEVDIAQKKGGDAQKNLHTRKAEGVA
jgi:hypothetical protein